ncbi:hypothetical protein D9613_004329 [Agrocybe pediades]|uniref:F-box domain-containing protein n=1 Tax=Agrocybe pediades TaxID=84607 RepID=A0A8H4QJF1_9AGAR|nr:hypothetical protein D9613_004329 [Agrocybe pediades]
MTCPHREDIPSNRNIINLSQLEYTKAKCPIEEGSCTLCQEILTVEKDIEEAVIRLKSLLSRHQRLKTELNHNHSPIIRDLPVEMLSTIFYSCFSEKFRQDDGELMYGDFFIPLKIGSVCRTWRQVARSTPELWTIIHFQRLFRTTSEVCDQYKMMEEWIHRSRALPIYVSLYEYAEENANLGREADGCNCWNKSLELLAQCCDRWKDATLDLSRASFEYIASNLKLKAPTRNLTLGTDELWPRVADASEVLNLWQESGFGANPITVNFNHSVRFMHFSIDWQCVTEVNAQGWLPLECAILLRHAPRLVSCTFTEVDDFGVESQPIVNWPIVYHNSLRQLSFKCDVSPTGFFNQVALTSLEEFEYSPHHGSDLSVDDGQILMAFLCRSGFRLSKLSLGRNRFTHEFVVALLNTVPSLKHVSLCFSYFPSDTDIWAMNSFLLHLSRTATSLSETNGQASKFLPRLEVLELHGCRYYDFPWRSVPDVFGRPSELGREGRRPLKLLVLPNWDLPSGVRGVPSDVVACLVGLQEAGVNISYRVRSGDGCKLIPMTWVQPTVV